MKQLLRPCPFCDSVPSIYTKDWYYFEDPITPVIQVRKRVKIVCKNCFLVKDIIAVRTADLCTDEKTLRFIARKSATDTIENFWNNRMKGGER